jgi:hypothetical protein
VRLPVQRRDDVLDYLGFLPVSDAVLAEAEAIVPHIKTLDAIHLASVVRSGLAATIVTHDATMTQRRRRTRVRHFRSVSVIRLCETIATWIRSEHA